jgi:hypothetical protein
MIGFVLSKLKEQTTEKLLELMKNFSQVTVSIINIQKSMMFSWIRIASLNIIKEIFQFSTATKM